MFKFAKRIASAVIAAAMLISCISAVPVSAAEVDGWTVSYSSAVGNVTTDNEIYYSGGSSLKIVNETPRSSSKYMLLSRKLYVEKGKEYKISGMYKSDGSDVVCIMVDWTGRWSIAPFSKKFDWTGYEYTYAATATKDITLQILCEGECSGFWVDEFDVTDAQTGKSLLGKNKSQSNANIARIDDTSVADSLFARIKKSEMFSASEIEQVMGGFKYIPTYKADGITIDGNTEDWENYPVISMPTLSTQYQVYINDNADKDVKAGCKFAYDEENLYILVDLTDDKFVSYKGANQYWQGDSLQIALSKLSESYGTEIGYVYLPETDTAEIYYESDRESNERGKMQCVVSQDGTRTVYEIAIPWTFRFDDIPKFVLLDILANDNDGNGRRYCAELAPGISEGKTNAQFPKLELLEADADWYAWVQGTREVYTDTDYEYEYYIVNKGEDKDFTIKNTKTGETEKITVPAGKAVRRTIDYVFDSVDETELALEISDGTRTHTAKEPVKVEKKLPTEAETREVIRVMREQDAELKKLIAECEEKNIPTHYETVTKTIIARFAEFMEDDIANDDFTRVEYTQRVTTQMFEKARDNLRAYLAGEKQAKDVPIYVTSDLDIDGQTIWADTETKNGIERRPVFFIGYGHGGTAREYVKEFADWGINSIQTECGPANSMTVGEVPHWNQTNNTNGTITECTDTVYDGEKSVKFTFDIAPTANQYLSLAQEVYAEAGKTYELTGYVKAQNGGRIRLELSEDGYTANNMINGTYDWKEVKVRYTVPEGKSRMTVRIIVDGTTDAVYFDKLSLCEVGKQENFLLNGSFEDEPNELGVYFNRNTPLFVTTVKTLEEAEKNNISVSVLISPHYMMTNVINKFDAAYRDMAFFKYNVHEPQFRPILEYFVQEFVSELVKYKSVNSICITNEPQFRVNYLPEYFEEGYREWLAERYDGDIAALNEAYRTEYADFTEIPLDVDFDKPETQNPAKWYDYKKYNDELLGYFHQWLAEAVKKAAPDMPVNAKVQGYTSYTGESRVMLELGTSYENIYEYMDLNGCDSGEYEDQPAKMKREMWYDYMLSFKNAPIADTEIHIMRNRSTDFRDEMAKYTGQEMWQGAIHGAGITDIWEWSRTYNHLSDSWLLELYRPDMIENISTANLDLNRLSYEIRALQQEKRDVGVIYSDVSTRNDETTMYSTYAAYEAANFCGKRVNFITETLLERMLDCKVIIVPHMPYATADTLPMLKKYIENGGKVLIMGEESLGKNERNLPSNSELLEYIFANSVVIPYEGVTDGMVTPTRNEYQDIVRNILSEEGLMYVTVKDAETGEYFCDVEYNIADYNGDLLVNIVNYGEKKNVRVFVGENELTEAVELRSGETVKGAVELEQYVPILLKVSGCGNYR